MEFIICFVGGGHSWKLSKDLTDSEFLRMSKFQCQTFWKFVVTNNDLSSPLSEARKLELKFPFLTCLQSITNLIHHTSLIFPKSIHCPSSPLLLRGVYHLSLGRNLSMCLFTSSFIFPLYQLWLSFAACNIKYKSQQLKIKVYFSLKQSVLQLSQLLGLVWQLHKQQNWLPLFLLCHSQHTPSIFKATLW